MATAAASAERNASRVAQNLTALADEMLLIFLLRLTLRPFDRPIGIHLYRAWTSVPRLNAITNVDFLHYDA